MKAHVHHKEIRWVSKFRACFFPFQEKNFVSAPGVDVECNSNNMTIVIPKSLLRGLDREHIRLLDTTCRARETNTHFFLTTLLNGCNTTRRFTPTAIVYSNAVLEIPVAAKGVITRVREIEIPFSCYLSKYGVVSSVASWKPSNRKLQWWRQRKLHTFAEYVPWQQIRESLHERRLPYWCGAARTSVFWSVSHLWWQAAVDNCWQMLRNPYPGSV